MKKIIITRKQLNKVNEDIADNSKTQVTFTGNNANEMGNNAQEKYNDATRSGLKTNAIQLSGKSIGNNASDKDETTIAFDSTQSNIRGAVTNAVQNAVNNGADINKLNVVGNGEDINNGISEAKIYTKRQVEEARLYEIRKNGKIMTKKQLKESCNNEEFLSMLKRTNIFKAMEAFRITFGDDAFGGLQTARDTTQYMLDQYCSSSPEKQQEFMARLKGERSDDPNEIKFEFDFND